MEKNSKVKLYTNEKNDIHFLRDLKLEYYPMNAWKINFSDNSFYFYRILMDFHVIENVKQQVLDMAKTYKNFYIFIDYGYEAYAYAYFHYVYKFITKNELQQNFHCLFLGYKSKSS